MSTRVSPTDQLRAEIDDLFADSEDERQLGDTLEEVARLGARLLFQIALEAEVTEFLCRNRYERRKAATGCPGREPQRLQRPDGQDHRRAGHPQAPEAPGHDRAVRLVACSARA